jgi:hypothetical protein
MLLSGISPALMKFILSGDRTLDEEGKILKTRTQVHPRETLELELGSRTSLGSDIRELDSWRGSYEENDTGTTPDLML